MNEFNIFVLSLIGIVNDKVLFSQVSFMDTYLLNYSAAGWREKLAAI